MKTFTSLVFLAASAALTSAQGVTFNETSGTFICPIANGTYCAGDSLTTNIIIRCVGFVGYPGNCNDNLDGEFPQALPVATCYASPTVPGVAACSKDCIVYGGSGNFNSTFTLPNCTQFPSSTSTVSVGTVTASVGTTTVIGSSNLSTTATIGPISSTVTVITSETITTSCSTTSVSIPINTGTFSIIPTGTGTGTGFPSPSSNATSGLGGVSGSATATPIGPTKSTTGSGPATFTGAAATQAAGAGLAAMGLLAAYLL